MAYLKTAAFCFACIAAYNLIKAKVPGAGILP